jgi:uncharacterized protein (UPF0332 family)
MGKDSLKWCFGLKDGLKIAEPSERLAKSYLEHAKSSLKRAEENFKDKDLLWTTVVIYYAEYYSLYSFLQRIGVKCENHFCSILAVGSVLEEENTAIINKHKDRRIDAQYYMKVGKENEVAQMLKEAKIFIATFNNIVLNLSQKDIENYRNNLRRLK